MQVIANTKYLWATVNPHLFLYSNNATTVTENFVPLSEPRTVNHSIQQVALYHYVLKSKEEFQQKMDRGSGALNHKTWEFFNGVDAVATVNCTEVYGRPILGGQLVALNSIVNEGNATDPDVQPALSSATLATAPDTGTVQATSAG